MVMVDKSNVAFDSILIKSQDKTKNNNKNRVKIPFINSLVYKYCHPTKTRLICCLLEKYNNG